MKEHWRSPAQLERERALWAKAQLAQLLAQVQVQWRVRVWAALLLLVVVLLLLLVLLLVLLKGLLLVQR
jgi:uncharacterized protein (DUF983 family)